MDKKISKAEKNTLLRMCGYISAKQAIAGQTLSEAEQHFRVRRDEAANALRDLSERLHREAVEEIVRFFGGNEQYFDFQAQILEEEGGSQ